MRIRLVSRPVLCSYDDALHNHQQCDCDIDHFLRATKWGDRETAVRARVRISQYVPAGVYIRADDETCEPFGVLGVLRRRDTLTHEDVFFVRYAPIFLWGRIPDPCLDVPLTGSASFLAPLARGRYRGPGYALSGYLIHSQ